MVELPSVLRQEESVREPVQVALQPVASVNKGPLVNGVGLLESLFFRHRCSGRHQTIEILLADRGADRC